MEKMVAKEEEFKCIWDGEETISIVTLKTDGKNFYAKKKHKMFPWIEDWHLVTGNIRDYIGDYQEKKLFTFGEGITDERVRIYDRDICDMTKNSGKMNEFFMRRMKNLESEKDFWFRLAQEAFSQIKDESMQDLVKQKFKDDYDYYVNKIKPNYTYNSDKSDNKKKS